MNFLAEPSAGGFPVAPDSSDNIEFWMQWPELLASDDTALRQHLSSTTNKYYKVDPLAYYKNLPNDKQSLFLTLVGLDKVWTTNEGGSTLTNETIGQALDASPKPNLIITGTNPYSPVGSDTDALIAKVKAKYGDTYDYFFKGHPSAVNVLTDKSITILPGRLPMEAIIWAYGDKISIMGGYEGSLYMNAPKIMKKFFFNEADDGTSLISPLNIMFKQGLLGEVEFIN